MMQELLVVAIPDCVAEIRKPIQVDPNVTGSISDHQQALAMLKQLGVSVDCNQRTVPCFAYG
jgi:hypothetical protein